MNILILNVHSALNLGDDAIMFETLRVLRAIFPTAKITVAANDPESWRKYPEIDVVGSLTAWVVNRTHGGWRWSKRLLILYSPLLALAVISRRLLGASLLFGNEERRRLLAAYYDADLVLSCGGGNFYAHRRLSIALIWALVTLGFAAFLGKQTFLLPQSLGPIEGRFQRFLARIVLARAQLIMLRERRSLDLAAELELSSVIVLPDLAFGLSAPQEQPLARVPGEEPALRIGLTVLDRTAQEHSFGRQEVYEDAIVALLVELNQERGARLYIYAQCYGPTPDQDDRLAAQRIFQRVREHTEDVVLVDKFAGAVEIMAAYSRMDCMIASRMHTAIFALTCGVPVAVIAYQPKAFGVMEMFGLERYCWDIETVTADHLKQGVGDLLSDKEAIRRRIRHGAEHVRDRLNVWPTYLQGS